MQIDSYFISDLFIYLFSHSNFDRNKDQFCDSIAININFCLINFCLIRICENCGGKDHDAEGCTSVWFKNKKQKKSLGQNSS